MQGRQFGQSFDSGLNLLGEERMGHVLVSSMHHPMPDRCDLAEQASLSIKYLAQRTGMIANFKSGRRTLSVLPDHFDLCDTSDAFSEGIGSSRPNPQNSARLFNYVHESKVDRRTSAVDHENMHVTDAD